MARNPFARGKSTDADTSAPKAKKPGRIAQILDVYKASKKADPVIGW